MLSTTSRRYAFAVSAALALVTLAVFVPGAFIASILLFAMAGVLLTSAAVADWCWRTDEDFEGSRDRIDRSKARRNYIPGEGDTH